VQFVVYILVEAFELTDCLVSYLIRICLNTGTMFWCGTFSYFTICFQFIFHLNVGLVSCPVRTTHDLYCILCL